MFCRQSIFEFVNVCEKVRCSLYRFSQAYLRKKPGRKKEDVNLRHNETVIPVDEPQLDAAALHHQIRVVIPLPVHELEGYRREVCPIAGKRRPAQHPGMARVTSC